MAWTIVKCSECGEEYKVQMYGPHRDREWKVNNWNGRCDDCKLKFKEQQEKERNEANQKAAEIAKQEGLLPLEGSTKQVLWAESLRLKRIDFIKVLIGEALKENNIDYAKWLKTRIEDTKTQKNASWFIDRRENGKVSFESAFANFKAKQLAEEFLK